MVLTDCELLDYGVIMKYKKSQLVKSTTSDNVYWIVGVDGNIYEVEDIWGKTHYGCDDDFSPLTINDYLKSSLHGVSH